MAIFTQSDAAILTDAFKDALESHGVATTKDIGRIILPQQPQTQRNTASAATNPPPLTNQSGTNIQLNDPGNIVGGLTGINTAAQRTTENLLKFPGQLTDTYDRLVQASDSDTASVVAQYNELQRLYGGMSTDLIEVEGSAKAATERLEGMRKSCKRIRLIFKLPSRAV